jgi:histidinol-phosphate aminotransferase
MAKIRLHMNEMPWSPLPEVIEAAKEGLKDLNRYSDEGTLENLRSSLGSYTGVAAERVIISPGSDILLREAVHLFSHGRKVITMSPSFLPTTEAARLTAGSMVRIRLPAPDFGLDKSILESEIEGPTLIFLDNPNNPTGKIVLSPEEIGSLLRKQDLLFILDEAYYEFSKVTCSQMVENYPNLLVTRTLDKVFSLAGTRIGYGLAGDLFLKKMTPQFTYLPLSTILASLKSLEFSKVMLERVEKLCSERERLYRKLRRANIEVFKSRGNFLLIKSPDPLTAEKLSERGILVKNLSDQMPPGFIRVSLGKPEENDLFAEELRMLLKKLVDAGSQTSPAQ